MSVVFIVFNEPAWIGRTVQRAADMLAGSRWAAPEIVVVDDGSTDETSQILDELKLDIPYRVIHQANIGRFLARKVCIEAATGDYILILDAKVLLEEGLDGRLDDVLAGKTVWNAVLYGPEQTSLLGTYWDSLVRIFWSDFFSNPREVSFGPEDFHRHPKGTAGLLLPRQLMLDAINSFSTTYSDTRYANDDTVLIEWIADRHRIWISPEFRCLWEPRHSLRRFVPHAFHRGLHFVDGFLHPGNPFAPVIMAFYAATIVSLVSSLRHKTAVPLAYLAVTTAAVGLGASRRLSKRHLLSLGLVTPIFVTAYGAGLWAGLWLRFRTRVNRPKVGST